MFGNRLIQMMARFIFANANIKWVAHYCKHVRKKITLDIQTNLRM